MAVLKQTEATTVRALIAPPLPVAVDEAAQLRADIAALRADAARAAETAKTAIAKAREDGLAEGRRAGIASVERSERERVELLAKGLAAEATRLSERLQALDGLAAALVRACLDRVFARPEAMAAMVVDALHHRLALLTDRTGLTVRVSGKDFTDVTALAGHGEVTIDPDLPSGACRIGVRLGQIDLDVPGQWAAIAQALDEMAGA
jgi:flagellar biosynthesis/type III secretory pathway protein FliH